MTAQPQLRKVFCVIDPTTNNQRALRRAATVATKSRAPIHAYLCISLPANAAAQDRDELRDAELCRHRTWLDKLVEPYRAEGLTVDTELECAEDWRSALVAAAHRVDADFIVRSSYRHSPLQRRMMKTTDWLLLRESRCPVLLVKTDRVGPLDKVLVALALGAKDEPHRRLNERLIRYAQGVAQVTGAELHAANAYRGSMQFVRPPDLAKRVGTARNHAHVADASPEEHIGRVAEKLGSPLVIIGSLARSGVAAAVVGNTAERLLDRLDCDVMVVVQTPEASTPEAAGQPPARALDEIPAP